MSHFEADRMSHAERKQEGYSEEQLENFALCEGLEKEYRRFMDSLSNYKTCFSPMTAPTKMSVYVSMMIEDITAVEVDDYIKAIRSKIEEM